MSSSATRPSCVCYLAYRMQADAQMDCPQGLTDEGYDLQLATNHLSHFILVEGLLPSILKSEGKTVVLVSSIGHQSGPVNWDDPNWKTTLWVTEKA